jgi:hypothetical protein
VSCAKIPTLDLPGQSKQQGKQGKKPKCCPWFQKLLVSVRQLMRGLRLLPLCPSGSDTLLMQPLNDGQIHVGDLAQNLWQQLEHHAQ